MDPSRFDAFVQTIGTLGTRRHAIAAILASVAAPLAAIAGAEAGRRNEKGHGKGRGGSSHKGGGKARGKPQRKHKGRNRGAAETQPVVDAADAKACRAVGHPCEGNQTCCNRDRVICVSSGPGEAVRCTACPDGQIACANACIPACTASDQCHVAGVCDPETGACTDPKADDGTACNDGDACTRRDTCRDGVCVGGDPVECRASDACHLPGTCDPQTGLCSNPAAPDGTACDDGNACTRQDACLDGICVGGDPVECRASDACHLPGTCDPQTGLCSNPAAPDGTACDDGNACTRMDTCQNGSCAGGDVVTCPASDACHIDGICDPASGACSNPVAPDGTPCGNGGTCTGGVCQEICLPYRAVCPDDDGPCCPGLQCRAVSQEPPPFVTGRCLSATCKDPLESCTEPGLPCCASGSTCDPQPFGGSICCSPSGGPCSDFGSSVPSQCCGSNVCNGSNTCAPCRQVGETCDGIGIASNCCNTPFSTNPILCHQGICTRCPESGEPCVGGTCCSGGFCLNNGLCP